MEMGYRIGISFQIILGWLLQPVYWMQSRKEKKLLPAIDDPLLRLSGTDLAQKIRKREITSTQVVKAYIRRITEVNPIINAVVEDRFKEALEDAERIDQYLAQNIANEDDIRIAQPLLGIPLTVKESCSLKGLSHAVGCKQRIGLKAAEDGETVRRLKNAGAIPLLVSNTPELCSGWESNNLVTGKTCNPYNTNMSSGGSSGGEAALLASGASVIGVGSDIAGSIRVPAMFNGIFGHKPTPRVISIEGHYPTSPDERIPDYLVIGPMTRYAEDLKLMMKAMIGRNTVNLQLDPDVDLSKINIYFMENAGKSKVLKKVQRDIKLIMRKSVNYLKEHHGSTVNDYKFDMENTCEMSASLFYNMKDIPNVLQDSRHGEIKSNVYVELLKRFFGKSEYSLNGLFFYLLQKSNAFIPKNRYEYYQSQADKLREEFLQKLDHDGIFLYPTFPSSAFQHNKIFTLTSGVMYTMIFNILGFPCTHVPLGVNDSGLPIGIQQQRAVTEQLRREAAIKRIPVSQAVADIIKFINEHEQEDCLLVGFSNQRINPFREKSPCTLL